MFWPPPLTLAFFRHLVACHSGAEQPLQGWVGDILHKARFQQDAGNELHKFSEMNSKWQPINTVELGRTTEN